MHDIVIKDSTMFENIINDLERIALQINDSFKNQDKNFSLIDGTDIYSGECQRVITDKYNETRKNYENIEEAIINYIKFLKITLENYKNQEQTFNSDIVKNIDNLDVNK